jgi:hypothetical protein
MSKYKASRRRAKSLPSAVIPDEGLTIAAWYKAAPEGRVTRFELMRVIDGMALVNRPEVMQILKDYDQMQAAIRRDQVWWRVWWRWIKATMGRRQSLADLSPAARQQVQDQLDAAAAMDQPEPSESPEKPEDPPK